MSTWVVGDIHGQRDALERLLEAMPREPHDELVFVGDLVNGGHDNVGALRLVSELDATVCLGNHDLHMLAVWAGQREIRDKDDFQDVLDAHDVDALAEWLLSCPLAYRDEELDLLVVHAGVLPSWTADETMRYAAEIEGVLRSEARDELFATMYGNEPDEFHPDLAGPERHRVLVNAFTRMRIVDSEGRMEFNFKDPYEQIPHGWYAWFDHPERRTADANLLFGHWSALGLRRWSSVTCVDSGVRWGGSLTALRVEDGFVAQVPALRG